MNFSLANHAGRAILVDGDHYHDIERLSDARLGSDPMSVLHHLAELDELAAGLGGREPDGVIDPALLGPPVPRPQKVFGIGLNYVDHASESKMDVPDNPLVFTKFPSCLVGATADVELRSEGCDYEGELVVVIGTGGKDIAAADAWNHVAGYTAGQDISDRIAQFAAKPPHFDLGKSFDTFGPIGPVLRPLGSFDDKTDVQIITRVNGEERQNGSTRDLIFDIPKLIEYLSHITTLVTGDLIFTGTPSGIGASTMTFLQDGDEIVTEIAGIGTLTNRCVRVSDHA